MNIKREIILKLALIALIGCFLVGGILLFYVSTLEIPDFSSFADRIVTKSTKIYDRTGEVLLYDVHTDVKRQVVSLDQIAANLKNATIAIEDDTFYQHHGFVFSSFLRAVIANLTSFSFSQGGSTITQQLVKKAILTGDKSPTRKIKELVLALKLERVMSKDEILEHYLNEIPYGGNLYGIEEASQAYFAKPAKDLTLAESAYLAALPQAPTYYSPYGKNRSALDDRKNLVLERMAKLGYISETEATAAQQEKIEFRPQSERGIKAPHFTLWIRDYLENKYGAEALTTGGLKVTTSLDWELQEKAEQIVKEQVAINKEKFNAKNAGLVAIDPKTGQILVMVGSQDYFDTENDGNFNVTLAHRQPGSSFKPFAYAEAFNKGFTPETMLFDLQTQFDTTCAGGGACYTPTNYDDKFRGPMSLRDALAQSINIPAIKVLYLAGISDTIKLAKSMGITSLGSANQYGLTLVLGGGEVSPLDMTSAYGVFANDGVRLPYASILKVEDANGNVLEEYEPKPEQVLPENTARLISDVLSDNTAKIPSYGINSPLFFPGRQVASKTGTTNDYKDAWIVGYTPSIVAGAWAGNNDNTPMEKKVAGLIVVPLWRAFMDQALKKMPVESFTPPEPTSPELLPVLRGYWQGGRSYFIDKASGKLATEDTPPELQEEKVLTEVHSILYWLNRKNDPQFDLWETPIRRWVAEQHIKEETEKDIPTETDDVHGSSSRPNLDITSPRANQSYDGDESLRVQFRYQGRYPLAQVDLFLNDQYLGAVKTAPFEFSFVPNETLGVKTSNQLRLVVRDTMGNKNNFSTSLRLK
jgi:1A family penicillin-binding protein